MSLAAFIADQRTSHYVPHAVACRALAVSESWSTSGTTAHTNPHRASDGASNSTRRSSRRLMPRTASTVLRVFTLIYVPSGGR